MATNAQPLPEKVPCRVCGKELDPSKPLGEDSNDKDRYRDDGFYCLDCWFRELRTETAESIIARAQDRVLQE